MSAQACGVTDYKFGTATTNSLSTVYKQTAPAGCQLAVCANYPNQAAVDTYRNDCEHPKPAYATLNGTGAGRYDAACTSCQS
ncbi:g3809 [Coccomyxa elongata]